MIEIIIVILSGALLIYIVRESRISNKKISDLNESERENLKIAVNLNPKKHPIIGGSFSKVPIWLVVLVAIVFIGAVINGITSIT